MMTKGFGWSFDNSYARLPGQFFTLQEPSPVRAPGLVILNEGLAADLGLDVESLKSEAGLAVFAGNQVPEGAKPLAQAYAGHQFGHFTMLGDGRAILLGEQINSEGKRYDIQLKGPGRTPYSRGGDGRAALGPMLREYIISEAMHALIIPTTRSLAVVTTGEITYRETKLPGAILTRVAASHIRVGTFQYASRWGTEEDLRTLADYTIGRHYPQLNTVKGEERYLAFLNEVIMRQAELISKWMLVGFIHGVMNTDNMTISGETIDYGPCAFIDTYDPATVFSSIDREGRYAFGNQPYIGLWNLTRFAETLLPLLNENQDEAIKLAEDALGNFSEIYQANWLQGMRSKLGLFTEEKEDKSLINHLLKIMHEHQADYTNTFRALTLGQYEKTPMYNTPTFKEWEKEWQERVARQSESKEAVQELMRKSNPSIIPRNHRVEEALEAAVIHSDYLVLEQLLAALADPYAYSSSQDEYTKLPTPSTLPYRTYCGT
jgi:serine/tyrosine/threonine adenylyltransferase